MRPLKCGIVVLWLVGAVPTFGQKAVFASEQMKGPWPNDVVVLQAGFGETLVFRETDPPYILDGRNLVIAADIVKVEGKVVIRAFRPDDVPLPKSGPADKGTDGNPGGGGQRNYQLPCYVHGCKGEDGHGGLDGANGESGKNAGGVRLQFQQMLGHGSLIIAAVGQEGEPGQRGGRGGAGGTGGKGKSVTCNWGGGINDSVPAIGNGGNGGRAGDGGYGGVGGQGGAGGHISYQQSLKDQISRGLLLFYIDGGLGGLGALGGDPGNPGQHGEGADGSLCSDGGFAGYDGRSGKLGERGLDGDEGNAGLVFCYDCPNDSVEALHAQLTKANRSDGTIVVKPAGHDTSGRKELNEESQYIEVRTEDGTNCVDIIPDAYMPLAPKHFCGSQKIESSIGSVRLLDGPTLVYVAFGPTVGSAQRKINEVCDVFVSCK
jgi:hypothetical protein